MLVERLLTKLGYVKEKRLADALKERDKWKKRCFVLVGDPDTAEAINVESEVEKEIARDKIDEINKVIKDTK